MLRGGKKEREKKGGISELPFRNSGEKHHSGGVWASKNRLKKIRFDDGICSYSLSWWREESRGLVASKKVMYNTCIVDYLCYKPIDILHLTRSPPCVWSERFVRSPESTEQPGEASLHPTSKESTVHSPSYTQMIYFSARAFGFLLPSNSRCQHTLGRRRMYVRDTIVYYPAS